MPTQDATTLAASRAGGDEIDLRKLFLTLWNRRWLIVGVSILSMAISGVYAFLIAKPVFESSALLLPTQPLSSDQLSAAAALFGKKSGSTDVDLYQSLLTSRTAIRKLLATELPNMSDSAKGRKEPLYRILKIDTTKPVNVEQAIRSLSESVKVGSKESGAGGILEIRFEAETPWLAQEIGQTLLQVGQEELRAVRVERASTILPRLWAVVEQAKAEWDSSARKVMWYKDKNRSIILPEQMLVLSRLQMEQQVREQKYLLARKEYETQVLEREKAAPPMMILDPANLPARKSKPKRAVLLAVGLIFGFTSASVAILAWNTFASPSSNKA